MTSLLTQPSHGLFFRDRKGRASVNGGGSLDAATDNTTISFPFPLSIPFPPPFVVRDRALEAAGALVGI